jgi:hypothetical protein
MNAQKFFSLFLVIVAGTIIMTSCSKENTPQTNEQLSAETLAMIEESTTTEMLDASINSSINEAIAYTENSSEQKSASISDCMKISIKPIWGYPKTITVDFGDGCTGENGFKRSGSFAITISDTLKTTGTTYKVTFNNFAIENYSVSGEISLENTSTGDIPSFYQEMDLTMTGASGVVIQKSKTADRAWIEGSDTEDITDDVFSISGSADVNSSEGGYYSYDITEPLMISYSCDFISEGVMQITTSGNEGPVSIDFGKSGCDRIVYISQGNILNKETDLSK